MTDTNIWVILIGVLGTLFIISPFFSKKRNVENYIESSDFYQEKELVFSQLADLEYDYQIDKLSKADYERTKSVLTEKAAVFLSPKKVDKLDIEHEVDKDIEEALVKKGLLEGRLGGES